jgi:large subunit ribosomal protein L29
MKAREIRELGAEELAQKIRETTAEVASMRMRKASGVAVDNYGKIRGMKRDIARMHTILTERGRQK